jgi:UDPglucose 6-dehydrogenase
MGTGTAEAESIKLFSNAYLAMRVAFFNELDTYSVAKNIDTKAVIEAMALDSRIGAGYNNPSFGYGGYCLPKDAMQVESLYGHLPHKIMRAIVDSNKDRKSFIAQQIIKRQPKTVGIYRLVMKQGSDNFRESAVLEIMGLLKAAGIEVLVYEPTVAQYHDYETVEDLSDFAARSSVIMANRMDQALLKYREKVYTRSVFDTN